MSRLDDAVRRVLHRERFLSRGAKDFAIGGVHYVNHLTAELGHEPALFLAIRREFAFLQDLDFSAATIKRHSKENAERTGIMGVDFPPRVAIHLGHDP